MNTEDVIEAFLTLKRAGWSIGDTAFVGPTGDRRWLVSGMNGENLIQAEGATQGEAWQRAMERARELGMGGWPIRGSESG